MFSIWRKGIADRVMRGTLPGLIALISSHSRSPLLSHSCTFASASAEAAAASGASAPVTAATHCTAAPIGSVFAMSWSCSVLRFAMALATAAAADDMLLGRPGFGFEEAGVAAAAAEGVPAAATFGAPAPARLGVARRAGCWFMASWFSSACAGLIGGAEAGGASGGGGGGGKTMGGLVAAAAPPMLGRSTPGAHERRGDARAAAAGREASTPIWPYDSRSMRSMGVGWASSQAYLERTGRQSRFIIALYMSSSSQSSGALCSARAQTLVPSVSQTRSAMLSSPPAHARAACPCGSRDKCTRTLS